MTEKTAQESQTQSRPKQKPQQALKRPKGTQDIFGEQARLWQYVESKANALFHRYGFNEIRTPVFESTDLFKRGVGETTDIVHKEMYTFEKSSRSLTLRPEGTAPVVRAYIEQGLHREPKPVKLFYQGPMFRYERPQAGRQRQFHQLGVEIFGVDSPEADAEVIAVAMDLFTTLDLKGLHLDINNLGTAECRDGFKEKLKLAIQPYLSELSKEDQTRFVENPLRMLDSKDPKIKALFESGDLKTLLDNDYTNAECQAHFAKVCSILDSLNIAYTKNPCLVRGLDYYTKTVFEITADNLGAQNAVAGGGRYNNLVEHLGGPATPATGWGLGIERLIAILENQNTQPDLAPLDFYIVTDQPEAAFTLARSLREKGKSVEVDLSGKNFGKQFALADKRGAVACITLGAEEAASKTVTVKTLSSGVQKTYSLDELLNAEN